MQTYGKKLLDINLKYIKHIYVQKISSINISITLHFFNNEKVASSVKAEW